MEKESIWGRRTFVIITGASRGIGKTIAIEFAKLIAKDSKMLLLARSIAGLEETKAIILRTRSNISVEVQSIDLSKPDNEHYSQLLAKAANNVSYDLYLIVHNAGTIIVDTPAAEMADLNQWNEYMTINMYSTAMLTSLFLKLFKGGKHCIVNITSIASFKPTKGLAMYCASKVCRELYFKVLALENPSVNVLNYSPGPVETDLWTTAATQSCFPDVIEVFKNIKTSNSLIKVEDTVGKLISFLEEQNYESGAIVQSIELSKPDNEHYSQLLAKAANSVPYDLYLIVHNAATTIVDTPAAEMADLNQWNEYMTINMYSAAMLTSLFLKLFKGGKHCIVNMTSLASSTPTKGLAMYCASKASRESYFKVLALENPSVNVLNYSPGPVETDMWTMTATQSCFPDIIETFKKIKTGNSLVKVEDTVGKLISFLEEQNYENGATVDCLGRL